MNTNKLIEDGAMAYSELIIVRHAQSIWNLQNRFSGWTDIPLAPPGIYEARQAGKLLHTQNYRFDAGFTSVLTRADHTLRLILAELGQTHIPIERSWRLNERHYGALQGLNKTAVSRLYSEAQVFQWRRGYHAQPPALRQDDPRHPCHDDKYQHLSPAVLPATETLDATTRRLLPYWHQHIAPRVAAGQRLIIASHGNTLRALVKYLDKLSDAAIEHVEIPTATPLVYRFDRHMSPVDRYYLTADGCRNLAVA